jgi:dTDP-4-amino-4,6-dideoxygalactose transaminase
VPDGNRDRLAAHLNAAGVGTAVYYPVPLHLQPALAAFGGRPGQLPHAEAAAAEVLALPIYPELSDEKVERVCAALRSFFTPAHVPAVPQRGRKPAPSRS